MAKEETKQNYSSKKIGPIHLVYAGKQHIGNVMEPTVGGSREGAQHYTAISKFWGIKQNHDSKMQAMQWLKQQHGEPMQMEAKDEKLTSTVHRHDYVHTSGMSGAIHHTAFSNGQHEFTSHPNPAHKLAGPFRVVQHSSMAKAHQRMKGLGYKHTGESGISESLNEAKKKSANFAFLATSNIIPQNLKKADEAPNFGIGQSSDASMDTVGVTAHTEMDRKKKLKFKKLIRKYPDEAGKTIDLLNGMFKTHETVLRIRKDYIKNEELFDKDVNEKDPKAGPKVKKNDPTGDTELQIKKTATGQVGDIIAINPRMKVRKTADDYSGNDPEHKSKPAV